MEEEGDNKQDEVEIPAFLADNAPVLPPLEVPHAYPDHLDNRADTNVRTQAMMSEGSIYARLP